MKEVSVSLAGIGLCEGCQIPVSMEDMPAEAMDAVWRCSILSCKAELTHKSFGYEQVDGEWQKVRWVGPKGQWVDEKPQEDFRLKNFYVTVNPPTRRFF